MKKNAILFSKVDREDGCVTGGIAIKVNNTNTYKDAFNEVKDRLETPEMINHVIESNCLIDDLFDGDDSYKFVTVYFEYSLYFVFENKDGDESNFKMQADFIYVV